MERAYSSQFAFVRHLNVENSSSLFYHNLVFFVYIERRVLSNKRKRNGKFTYYYDGISVKV